MSRLDALVRSGRVHPLIPLGAPLHQPRRDVLAQRGRVILKAVEALLLKQAPPDTELGQAMRAELEAGRTLGATRLDVVMPQHGEFQLLEVQAGDPSAMGWHDELAEHFAEAPTLMPAHRRAFEALTGDRRIAFVVKGGSIVESDHRLLAEHFSRHGWQARVVDPSQLTFDGAQLLAAGAPVSAMFRDALDELEPGLPALLAAVRAKAVVVQNPFVAALADDKALLEALTTPSAWSRATNEVLQAHVPCTRVIRERRVEWEGKRVELAEFIRTHRESLVLKPVDGYGGFGITLGPFVTQQAWEQAVNAALLKAGRFVVQRYHPLPKQPVTFIDGQAREAFVVHSLWFNPDLVGAYARASDHPVVNVHQGGGLTPVFFRPPFS